MERITDWRLILADWHDEQAAEPEAESMRRNEFAGDGYGHGYGYGHGHGDGYGHGHGDGHGTG